MDADIHPLPEPAWGTARPKGLASICIGAIRHRVARGVLRVPCRHIIQRASPHYDVDVDGIRMRCHASDNRTEQMLIERGLHKKRETIRLITADGLEPGGVFVDIGANCGLYSLFAARGLGPKGRVLAIEPVPEMVRRLRFNAAANGFENIQVFPTALGEAPGVMTLYVKEAQYGVSSVGDATGTATEVPVAPLLAIVEAAKVERVDALKIDVEGHEDHVLIPFIRTAPSTLWPRRILMETAHSDRWTEDCVSILLGAGYREEWRDRSDMLLVKPA